MERILEALLVMNVAGSTYRVRPLRSSRFNLVVTARDPVNVQQLWVTFIKAWAIGW